MERTEREIFERALREATARRSGRDLDEALCEIGWGDALAVERRLAVSVLFEGQGCYNATSSALDDLLGAVLGSGVLRRAAVPEPESLDALVEAEAIAVVLPALGRFEAPGKLGTDLSVSGLATSALDRSDDALALVVVADDAGGETAVAISSSDLRQTPIEGMDARLGLVAVAGELESDGPAPRFELAPGTWAAAVDQARLAIAHELVGAASAMLELARAHALDRVQFGRPIASFQAVRHRLADTLVAIDGARALLDVAWEDPSSETIAMAKATSGRAARSASGHCQQVLAGMGFTTEHPLHRYVRRVLVLDDLFGSARVLTRDLGERLVGGAPLPRAVPL